MTDLERLSQQAKDSGIVIVTKPMRPRIKGLYCNNVIALNALLNSAEQSCILAEELGHHFTSTGNILDQTDAWNRKQEHRARMYGYNLRIGLMGIIRTFEKGCRNLYEVAEELGVTEAYLSEALSCYRDKYGTYTTVDNYVVYFIPSLMVCKLTE